TEREGRSLDGRSRLTAKITLCRCLGFPFVRSISKFSATDLAIVPLRHLFLNSVVNGNIVMREGRNHERHLDFTDLPRGRRPPTSGVGWAATDSVCSPAWDDAPASADGTGGGCARIESIARLFPPVWLLFGTGLSASGRRRPTATLRRHS